MTATAWKVSVFGVFLVRIFLHSTEYGEIRTRKTQNTDTFPGICIRLILPTPNIIHFFIQVYVMVHVRVIMTQLVEATTKHMPMNAY